MVILPIALPHYGSPRIAVEARLRAVRAVSPESAVAFVPTDLAGMEEAIGLGRIARTVDGRLFLNPAAVAAPRFGGAMAFLLILLSAASVAASVVMMVRFAAR